MSGELAAARTRPSWNDEVQRMATVWAKSPQKREITDGSTLILFEAAALYLAGRFGPRAAAEELYRLADQYAVMPPKASP